MRCQAKLTTIVQIPLKWPWLLIEKLNFVENYIFEKILIIIFQMIHNLPCFAKSKFTHCFSNDVIMTLEVRFGIVALSSTITVQDFIELACPDVLIISSHMNHDNFPNVLNIPDVHTISLHMNHDFPMMY